MSKSSTETAVVATKGDNVKPVVKTGGKVTGGLVPKDFDQMYRVAHIFANSGMIPRHFTSPAQVFVAMELGMEIGLPPMAAVQNIAVINGRPSVWGDAALGVVRASGLLKTFKESPMLSGDEITGYKCEALRTNGDEATHVFTLKMADRAGLRKKDGPWKQYPERMLQMRARGFVLRDLFPDVLRGLYLREELDEDSIDAEDVVTIEDPLSGLEAKIEEIKATEPLPDEIPEPEIEDAEVVEDKPKGKSKPKAKEMILEDTPEPQKAPETPPGEPEEPSLPLELPPQVEKANEDFLLRTTMEIKSGRPSAWKRQFEALMDRGVAAYEAVGWEKPDVEWAVDVCSIMEGFEVERIDQLAVNKRPDFQKALTAFVEQAEDNAEKTHA